MKPLCKNFLRHSSMEISKARGIQGEQLAQHPSLTIAQSISPSPQRWAPTTSAPQLNKSSLARNLLTQRKAQPQGLAGTQGVKARPCDMHQRDNPGRQHLGLGWDPEMLLQPTSPAAAPARPGWAPQDAVCMELLFHGKLAVFLLFICQQDFQRICSQI